jgi:hypothetical protein
MPAQWEGDLIKGKGNAPAVGTLVKRSTVTNAQSNGDADDGQAS